MKNNKKIPHTPLMCDFSESKESLKFRFSSLFDDSKKKKGIISLVVVLVLIGVISSFFAFGNKEIEQVNDSLLIYTRGIETMADGNWIYHESYRHDDLVEDYRKEYPDVDVKIVEHNEMGADAFTDLIATELLAGKGPDVIIYDDGTMRLKDINKIIASGVIAPMDEFLEADETFKQEDYYQGIIKSGTYRGKRYAMPMRFNLPVLASGENVLKKAGIDKDACTKDYVGFMEQCASYVNSNLDNADAAHLFFTDNAFYASQLLNYMGINPTKENKTIDTPEFRSVIESMKALKQAKPPENGEWIPPTKLMQDGKVIFSNFVQSPISGLSRDGVGAIKPFDTPVLIPMRKQNGNVEAIITDAAMINANSANKQNAYNFIKMLMSYKTNMYFMNNGLSPRRAFAEATIRMEGSAEQYFEGDNYTMVIVKTPEAYREEMKTIVNSVDSANFATPIIEVIIAELQPFLDGKMTYEECIKQAQSKVDLYFSE